MLVNQRVVKYCLPNSSLVLLVPWYKWVAGVGSGKVGSQAMRQVLAIEE